MISKANEKGMLVLLAPAYLGYQGGDEGWYQEMSANGATKLRAYGQWVANRFKNYDNILWVQGGDYDAPDKTLARAVANGIRDIDTNGKWLQIVPRRPRSRGARIPGHDVGSVADRQRRLHQHRDRRGEAQGRYAGSNMPFVLIEAGYENNDTDGGTFACSVTRQWSGATGQVMGTSRLVPRYRLASALDSGGATTLGHLPEALDSTGIASSNLVPDSDGTVPTSSPGTGSGRAVAARMNDGTRCWSSRRCNRR